MRPLSASELLEVWDQGLTQSPVQRALSLLSAACPNTTADELAELSIGQRDTRLLTLREWTFGPQLISRSTCPSCGERLELTINISDIRAESKTEPSEALSLNKADYEVSFRLPNSRDLIGNNSSKNVAVMRDFLLKRCLLAVQRNGEQIATENLPGDVIDAIIEEMAKYDPQADVQLDLSCPACDHQWGTTFDIVTFFWEEIKAWVQRIMIEVHTLASTYGWCEKDILAMSSWKRKFYLQMTSG